MIIDFNTEWLVVWLVLPKFEVTVDGPKYITSNDGSVKINILGK